MTMNKIFPIVITRFKTALTLYFILLFSLQTFAQRPFEFKQGSVLISLETNGIKKVNNGIVSLDFKGIDQPNFHLNFQDLKWNMDCPKTEEKLEVRSDLLEEEASIMFNSDKFYVDSKKKLNVTVIKDGRIHLKLPLQVSLEKIKNGKTQTFKYFAEQIIEIKNVQQQANKTISKNQNFDLPAVPEPVFDDEDAVVQLKENTSIKEINKPKTVQNATPVSKHLQTTQVDQTNIPTPDKIVPIQLDKPKKVLRDLPMRIVNEKPAKVTSEPIDEKTPRSERIAPEKPVSQAGTEVNLQKEPPTIEKSNKLIASIDQIGNSIQINITSGKAPFYIRIADDRHFIIRKEKLNEEPPFTIELNKEKLLLDDAKYLVSIKDARKTQLIKKEVIFNKKIVSKSSLIPFQLDKRIMIGLFLMLIIIFSIIFMRMNLFQSFIRS